MVVPKPWIKFTVKEYMSLPEGAPYQLLDGEMILAPSSTQRHQNIAAKLFLELRRHVDEKRLGQVWFAPLDVELSEHHVAQPDLLFVSNSRSEIVTEANIQGGPDLVVEIISPALPNTTGDTSNCSPAAMGSWNIGGWILNRRW